MLQFKNVTKSFLGKEPILRKISFQVDQGEFLFLTGVSGAGKTTIYKMLLGLEDCDKGEIRFFDENVCTITSQKMPYHRRKIGMVFQDYKLLMKRTVEENLSIPLMIQGNSRLVINEKIKKTAQEVEIKHLLKQKVFSFPGGEQQLVAIARSVITSPKILLADEPTANLDEDTARHIISVLRKINRKGTSVFIATHDIHLIKGYATRILLIKNQKVSELYKQ